MKKVFFLLLTLMFTMSLSAIGLEKSDFEKNEKTEINQDLGFDIVSNFVNVELVSNVDSPHKSDSKLYKNESYKQRLIKRINDNRKHFIQLHKNKINSFYLKDYPVDLNVKNSLFKINQFYFLKQLKPNKKYNKNIGFLDCLD